MGELVDATRTLCRFACVDVQQEAVAYRECQRSLDEGWGGASADVDRASPLGAGRRPRSLRGGGGSGGHRRLPRLGAPYVRFFRPAALGVHRRLERRSPPRRARLPQARPGRRRARGARLQLGRWLEVAPTPAYDAPTRAAIRAEPVVQRLFAAADADAGLWPELLPPCASDRGCRWRSLRVSSPSASASACRSRADRGLPRAPRAWRARDLAALAPPARRASDALGRLARTTGRRRRLRPRPAPGKRRRHAVPPGGRRRRLGGRRLRGLERGGPRAGAGRGARRGRPALPRRPGRLVNRRLAEQPHDCVRERRFCLGVATQHGVQAAAPQRLGGYGKSSSVPRRSENVGQPRRANAAVGSPARSPR